MIGEIKPFNTIGEDERAAVRETMFWPLSGYLAGRERGGYYVRALEDEWAKTFGVKHAIACNSATSGLMAAAFAIGLERGKRFLVPAMTMSATAAAPMFTGATPVFGDVDERSFCLSASEASRGDAIFLTHLFGLNMDERWWADHAHKSSRRLVVDASQAPFAKFDGHYAGTMADIGVFSLNVHKPLQCGEGGMMVTDDDDLALYLRRFINHGENDHGPIGLNLRMPEVCAAIARVQLTCGKEVVKGRRKQARAIIGAIGDIGGLTPPINWAGNAYYAIPFLVEHRRREFCEALRAEGVPIVEGYVAPLNTLPAFSDFGRYCPVAGDLHHRRLLYFENCAYDPTPEQIEQIGAAFRKAAEMVL